MDEVAIDVYQHESMMHHILQEIQDSQPINADPWWVHDQYKNALQPLLSLCSLDSKNPNIYVARFQEEVVSSRILQC